MLNMSTTSFSDLLTNDSPLPPPAPDSPIVSPRGALFSYFFFLFYRCNRKTDITLDMLFGKQSY
ncbi:hypothetical protein LguiA_033564 [Lonicera macranthoides]